MALKCLIYPSDNFIVMRQLFMLELNITNPDSYSFVFLEAAV